MEPTTPTWLKSTKGTSFTGIGSLEADILAIIWERERATVRDVYETLRERRKIAYTTVMTVTNNLVKKELLTQDRSSIAYVYTPAILGNEVASMILDSVVERLFRGRSNLALSHLLALKRDLNPEQAEELRKYAEQHFVAWPRRGFRREAGGGWSR
jgi:BlaI family penicillinase repressor